VKDNTTVQLLQEAHHRADVLRVQHHGYAAGREFALASTAIEDAIMRFNRGQAELRGTRRDFDFEAQPEVERS
jgi:hypothetical protein